MTTTARPRKYGPGQARFETILTAAADLFHTKGFENTTIEEIGRAAGISGPGIYRHFSSKQDILVQLFERGMRRHLEILEMARQIEDPTERVRIACVKLVETSMAIRFSTEPYYQIAERGEIQRLITIERTYISEWIKFISDARGGADLAECRAIVFMMGGLLRGAISASERLDEARIVEMTVPAVVFLVTQAPLTTRPPRSA